LLRESGKVDVESIGVECLRSLTFQWSRDVIDVQNISPASVDILDIVEKQAISQEFWKADLERFTKHDSLKPFLSF
jgi:hypothetical protein